MKQSITHENLGSWLIKCNPDTVFDLKGFMERGNDWIGSWTVVDNYRSHMMAKGDRIILWASGTGKNVERGIWGVGYVVGPVADPDPYDEDVDGEDSWIDREAKGKVEYVVPVSIQLFDEPITAEALKEAGILDLEVQTQPQMSNPSWVSVGQLPAVEEIVGGWDDFADHEPSEWIDHCGSFARVIDNFDTDVLARATVDAVFAHYEGWESEVGQADDVWDIRFTEPDTGDVVHVRTHGVRTAEPIVVLTPRELQAARDVPGWHLAVVTHAVTDPTVVEFTAEQVLAQAESYVYRADFTHVTPAD